MTSIERLSPMSLYYLRHLIHDKSSELSLRDAGEETDNHLDQLLSQLNRASINSGMSVRVLEQLITLHQSLVAENSLASVQMEEVESKIYAILNLNWTPSEEYLKKKSIKLRQFSPQKCREILKSLYNMKQKYESLASPKIVQNYLIKSCPHNERQDAEMNQVSAIDNATLEHRLQSYEEWIHAFIQSLENILVHDESSESTDEHEPKASNNEVPRMSWRSICVTAILLGTDSHQSSPKRYRDLLAHMNRLLETSQSFMNPELAKHYFLTTRPEHEWCQRFQVSPKDKILFNGSSRAIVTQSYLTFYKQWMNAFIKKCSVYAPFEPTRKAS